MQALASPEDFLNLLTNAATKNYLGSVTLMKQLTVATVSMIAYLKDAFPEDSYNIEKFKELKLPILKKNCRDESAQFLSTALINAFDAFDKKYLDRLALCFYMDECKPENLVDYHIFEYKYHAAGAGVRVHSGRELEDDAYHLLQYCTVVNNGYQTKTPASLDFSLKLCYNEAAPIDYQAPGFSSSSEFEQQLSQQLSPVDMSTFSLGDVTTPYHGLRVTSRFNDHLGFSNEAIASQNTPLMTQTQDVAAFSVGCKGALRCPCGLDRTELRDVTSLITCNYCKTQQHAVCFGVLRGAGEGHCCAGCAAEDPARRPTCLRLTTLDHKKREYLCAARLALAWCEARGAASEPPLAALGLQPRYVTHLLEYLHNKQVLAHDDWQVPQKVKEGPMRKVMAAFFPEPRAGVVERLLQETRDSQDSPDPAASALGPALGPAHLASLRKTSAGRVERAGSSAGRSVSQSPGAGDLLQQYRDALTPTLTEDPLADTLAGMGLGRSKRKASDTTFRSIVKAKRSRVTFE